MQIYTKCENVIACKVCSSEERLAACAVRALAPVGSGTHEFLTAAILLYMVYICSIELSGTLEPDSRSSDVEVCTII